MYSVALDLRTHKITRTKYNWVGIKCINKEHFNIRSNFDRAIRTMNNDEYVG